MAELTTVKEVCDICHSKRRKVKHYRVGEDGFLVKVALCAEHGQYVENLIEIGTVVPSNAPTVKVWTMEEILARKQGTKKSPPARKG